jgi:hypothetical protein
LGVIGGLLEEWGVVDVGGCIVPVIVGTLGGIKLLPHFATLEDVLIGCLEHFGLDH